MKNSTNSTKSQFFLPKDIFSTVSPFYLIQVTQINFYISKMNQSNESKITMTVEIENLLFTFYYNFIKNLLYCHEEIYQLIDTFFNNCYITKNK
jgi:hypothetical protein